MLGARGSVAPSTTLLGVDLNIASPFPSRNRSAPIRSSMSTSSIREDVNPASILLSTAWSGANPSAASPLASVHAPFYNRIYMLRSSVVEDIDAAAVISLTTGSGAYRGTILFPPGLSDQDGGRESHGSKFLPPFSGRFKTPKELDDEVPEKANKAREPMRKKEPMNPPRPWAKLSTKPALPLTALGEIRSTASKRC